MQKKTREKLEWIVEAIQTGSTEKDIITLKFARSKARWEAWRDERLKEDITALEKTLLKFEDVKQEIVKNNNLDRVTFKYEKEKKQKLNTIAKSKGLTLSGLIKKVLEGYIVAEAPRDLVKFKKETLNLAYEQLSKELFKEFYEEFEECEDYEKIDSLVIKYSLNKSLF